ncbi:MAG: hypothetical protein ACI4RC_00110 [Oscillospiraceae bacterium]
MLKCIDCAKCGIPQKADKDTDMDAYKAKDKDGEFVGLSSLSSVRK